MITKTYKIPIFDYNLIFFQLEKSDKQSYVEEELDKKMISGDERPYIGVDLFDVGHTCTNEETRTIVVFFHRFSTVDKRYEIYFHELRHIVDSICIHLNLNCLETAAYLNGFIGNILFIDFIGLTIR